MHSSMANGICMCGIDHRRCNGIYYPDLARVQGRMNETRIQISDVNIREVVAGRHFNLPLSSKSAVTIRSLSHACFLKHNTNSHHFELPMQLPCH